jgi:drug/metabolite transporter (DMT)-like permease
MRQSGTHWLRSFGSLRPLPVSDLEESNPMAYVLFPSARRSVSLSQYWSPVTIGRIALITTAFLQGTSTIASKVALDHMPPIMLAFSRFGIAALILLAVCHRMGARPHFGWDAFLLGFFGVAVAFAAQNIGLEFTTATTATLIIEGSFPVVTIALGIWLLRERINRQQAVALVLAIAGVAMAMVPASGSSIDFSMTGALLTLVAGISLAAHTVLGRRLFRHGVSIPIVTGSVVIGTLLLAPVALVEFAMSEHVSVTFSAVSSVLYLGVGGSALVTLLWARGLHHIRATEVAALGTIGPVVGIVAATLFLGESMNAIQFGGGAVIGLGIYLFMRQYPAP